MADDSYIMDMFASDDEYLSAFNTQRYKTSQIGGAVPTPDRGLFSAFQHQGGAQTQYADAADAYANINKMVISFFHVPTARRVYFKAFITAFNESYSNNWNSEEIYGRADPVFMYKNSTRDITLAFKIPAATESEAYENLGRVSSLAKFLYPAYENVQGSSTITRSPFMRIKVMNLLQSTAGGTMPRAPGALESSAQMYGAYTSNTSAGQGLLGVVKNLVINHNITDQGVLEKAAGTVLPKLIDVNLSFSVLHEHAMGWDSESRFGPPAGATSGQGSNIFPYGVTLNDPAAPLPPMDTKAYDEMLADMRTQPGYQQALKDEAEAKYRGFLGDSFGDQSRMDDDLIGGTPREKAMAKYAHEQSAGSVPTYVPDTEK